jgi:hypothetical protein
VTSGRSCSGVNDTLDAVIGPLNVAASYVDRISKGDLPPKITDNYNGDFNAHQDQPQRADRGDGEGHGGWPRRSPAAT